MLLWKRADSVYCSSAVADSDARAKAALRSFLAFPSLRLVNGRAEW